mgnify:CR=1 FL=1|jgi:hypothetical protein|tara:strand:- start:36960 stop:37091 length:132 start_codon:yes stop_codon:yes gene_type:complete
MKKTIYTNSSEIIERDSRRSAFVISFYILLIVAFAIVSISLGN